MYFSLSINLQGEVDYSKISPEADIFAPPRGYFYHTHKLLVISLTFLDHVDDVKQSSLSGWKLFFLIVIGLVGVSVCAMIGFVIVTKRAEDHRKRFY